MSQKFRRVLKKLFLNFPEIPRMKSMALFNFSFSKFVKETVQRHKSWIQQETLFWKCYNTPVEEYFSKQIQIQTDLMSA